ncbi:unnamed protein product [Ectocarpus sp. CCAP 1310/34]|nr:unnamed protein product [Ectocarpus sp. CCAP 1310/34]
MRCVCGIALLVMITRAEAFVTPSAFRLSAAVAPSTRLLYSGQQGRRVVTMAAEGLPPGDHNIDPLDAQSSIPDSVGSAAIRRQIDSIKRSRGAGKRTPRQGESIRWVASTESEHRARPTLLPRAVWVLLFSQGSGSFGSSSEPQRGLYCLWSKGTNSALAFEEREGALRYAFKLKEKGLGIPTPTRVSMTDLQRFCLDHSFGIRMIPADVVPEAPRKTKKDLGFDPLNLTSSPHGRRDAGEDAGPVLTPDDIRKWRAKFERLYAQE